MYDLTPEKGARQQIDAQLAASGWVVQDYKSIDFSAGRGVAIREVPLKTGPCDYLLLVDRAAVGVVEAKKVGSTLSKVAEQSARYATSLPALLADGRTGSLPFLYESTGVETFFRDSRDPHPRSGRVFSFHRPETLGDWFAEPETLRARFEHMPAESRPRAAGQANLTLEICRDLPIPLPPLPEQRRIVAEVERRLSVVDELEAVVTANLQRAVRLRQSILQKAFTGTLV